jgi:Protein of unknown function (DUF1549)/Protein of unknown function (DUF1553)/Planctomycete cytochrome C/Glycosyl hydrolases family 2, sugar binding domain
MKTSLMIKIIAILINKEPILKVRCVFYQLFRFSHFITHQKILGLLTVLLLMSSMSMSSLNALEPQNQSPDFEKEIAPLLLKRCGKCHAHGQAKGEFSVNSRETLLKGGASGPAVIEGNSKESLFMELITGVDPDRLMPENGPKLSDQEIELFKKWIDTKLPWPKDFRLSYGKETPLPIRVPVLPKNSEGLTNPVDLILQTDPVLKNKLLNSRIPDRVFLRRTSLDLTGLLPTPKTIKKFNASTHPDKRDQYLDALLNNRTAYAGHWLTFWNDALRNAYRGTGFIDNGRNQLTGWLYQSLYENKPYNQFVHELISPVPGSEAFVKGIIWRGVVNASQRKEMQAAQNISQVFLGINLKCASCHDSFVNEWKLKDSHALAAVFSNGPFELYECDKPVGEKAIAAYLFPELGKIDVSKSREERMKQLAGEITSSQNARFARTIVNRLWAQLLGRGIVEPLDQMSGEPWNRDLIDWLSADLIKHQFNLKRTLKIITSSHAYQLPSVGWKAKQDSVYQFQGPIVKRMNAAQYVDALAALTKMNRHVSSLMLNRDGRGQGGQLSEIRNALASLTDQKQSGLLKETFWIWSQEKANINSSAGTVYFRKTFQLEKIPEQMIAVASCDNEFELFLNGQKVMSGKSWKEPIIRELTSHLKQGKNVIAVKAVNSRVDKKKTPSEDLSPAGFIFRMINSKEKQSIQIKSDESWLQTIKVINGWETVKLDDSDWKPATVLGTTNLSPWNLESTLLTSIDVYQDHVRASLENNDPLKRALGRPSRDQVVTKRESLATMLQALEMTNGNTLDNILKSGANQWFKNKGNDSHLVSEIFQTAFGREPDNQELKTAFELIGSPVTAEGIQDLLWTISMLPEFQLIY